MLDATHFRQRAARAREMAQSGDDVRLAQMLLEVARDMEAEADAIEAGDIVERRRLPRIRPTVAHEALLHVLSRDDDTRPVRIVNLSTGGAKIRANPVPPLGSKVILDFPGHALRLDGTIVRVRGVEAAMIFDAASSADPDLSRLLRSESQPDSVRV